MDSLIPNIRSLMYGMHYDCSLYWKKLFKQNIPKKWKRCDVILFEQNSTLEVLVKHFLSSLYSAYLSLKVTFYSLSEAYPNYWFWNQFSALNAQTLTLQNSKFWRDWNRQLSTRRILTVLALTQTAAVDPV